jgi:glutaredoxin 2
LFSVNAIVATVHFVAEQKQKYLNQGKFGQAVAQYARQVQLCSDTLYSQRIAPSFILYS